MLTRTGRRCLFILLDKFQINSAKKQRADWYPVAVTNWREAAPLKYFLWRLNLCRRLLQTFFSVLHRYHWTNPLLSKRRELCTRHVSVMPTDVFAHVWFSLLEPSWAEIYLHQPGGPTLLGQHFFTLFPPGSDHTRSHRLAWCNSPARYPHVTAQGVITEDFSSLQKFSSPANLHTPRLLSCSAWCPGTSAT